jgi:hypothetical protein
LDISQHWLLHICLTLSHILLDFNAVTIHRPQKLLCSLILFLQRERPHPSTAQHDTTVDRPDLGHDPDRKKEKGRKIDPDRRDHEKDGEYDSKDLLGIKRKTFPKMEAETHQGVASISASSYNDNGARKSESPGHILNAIKMSIRADICAVWHHQCAVVLFVSIYFRIIQLCI